MTLQIEVLIRRLSDTAKLPVFAHEADACADIYADTQAVLQPGEFKLISTGIAMQLPRGYECQVRPRSGMAAKYGITVLNSPGTIDAGYRGEVKVILINHGSEAFMVMPGMRIAQLAVRQVPNIQFKEVDQLNHTPRNTGGFGSTDLA